MTQPGPGGETPGGGQVAGGGATPDLSPVGAPAELIAYGRLGNPGGVVDTITQWAKLPVDVRRLIEKEEPDLARLLVYDAPIEFAVALDPKGRGDVPQPFAVVSIGLASVDGAVDFAKREGQSVRQQSGGIYKIAKSGGPACAVAPSVGKAPARLVCGDRPEDVDALLGYATRGLPNENMGNADLHMELRAEPIRRLYGKQLRQMKTIATPFVLKEFSLDSPRFDRALAEAVHKLADELLDVIDDLDKIAIDGWVKKDSGTLDLATAIKLKGQKSWIVGTVVDASKRSKGIPEMYWRLPKDASSATYGMGATPKRYDPLRKSLAELMDGLLEHEKIPKKVRDQLTEIVMDTWTTEGAVVYAHGDLPRTAAPAAARPTNKSREKVKQEIGWYVMGIDDKPAKYKTYFDKIAKLYNDAQVKQVFDKRLKIKPNELPRLAARGGRGLPPGSTVYELTVPGALFDKMDPFGGMGAKKAAAAALPVVLAVIPEGDKTWIALSTDEKLLGQKLADTKKPEATLASRDGLAPLKTAGGQGGGFISLGYFVNSIMSSELASGADASKVFAAMPSHGETPMIVWSNVTPDGPKLTWTMRIPKAVVEDIAAMAPAIAAGALGAGSPPPPPVPRGAPPPPTKAVPPGKAPPAPAAKPPATAKPPAAPVAPVAPKKTP